MRTIGLILFIIGMAFFLFGIHASQNFFEKCLNILIGRYSKETMWYLIGGLAVSFLGAAMMLSTLFFTTSPKKAQSCTD